MNAFKTLLEENKLDAYLVTGDSNLTYFTQIHESSPGILLTKSRGWAFISKLSYGLFQEGKLNGYRLFLSNNWLQKVEKIIKSKRLQKVGFDPNHVNFNLGKKLLQLGWRSVPDLITKLRSVKHAEELKKIRKACLISAESFRWILPKIRPGKAERQIALELENKMKQLGANGLAFDTIVASGPNGAIPHYGVGDKIIKNGEAVVVDFGCLVSNYRSDMTRTVLVGKISSLVKRIYRIVKHAQQEGIAEVHSGTPAEKVDFAARKIIRKAGYGRYFIHSTGHGVGLDIHEAPAVSKKSKDLLRPGMVITVEPGIYLPGKFGVRIEDTLLVTEEGSVVLTQ